MPHRGIGTARAIEDICQVAYVPTQVLTEYFRCLSPLSVDGTAFRSAHNGGVNYVLFTGPEGCVDPGAETSCAMLRLARREASGRGEDIG
ncbi:RES domain-containing protein [Streptomyces sp. NPDC058412]|uniref:RES domain-containing protein n=1 Tax=Streptomyces sp. NPDC058412 TaxID=3346486 RepID=UPI003661997D